MVTYVPIDVDVGKFVWRTGKVTEYEIGEALKLFLVKCVFDKQCRIDFEYVLDVLAETAEKLCNETEKQWFCILAANLRQTLDKLGERGGDS